MPIQTSNETDPILQFFSWGHLPAQLRKVSEPFGHLAIHLVTSLPRNPERTVALRKLLEAKDATVRAFIFKTQEQLETAKLERAEQAAPTTDGEKSDV